MTETDRHNGDSDRDATDGGVDESASGTYRCHSVTNDVATLLLTDPVLNDRLDHVMSGFECDGCGGSFDGRPDQLVNVHDEFETYCGECSEVPDASV